MSSPSGVQVAATNAPSGRGTAAWDNGELSGDPIILDEAKRVTQVNPHTEHAPVPMDWTNPLHASKALQQGAERTYGQPIIVIIERGDTDPAIDASTFTPGE